MRLAGSREIVQEADEEVVALLDLLERELSPELRALVLLRRSGSGSDALVCDY